MSNDQMTGAEIRKMKKKIEDSNWRNYLDRVRRERDDQERRHRYIWENHH